MQTTLTNQKNRAWSLLLTINNLRISISKISKNNLRMIWYQCRQRKQFRRQSKFHPRHARIQYSLNSAKSANLNKRITYFLSLIWSLIKSKKVPTRAQNMALLIYSINSGMILISWTSIRLHKIKTKQKMISISSILIQIELSLWNYNF